MSSPREPAVDGRGLLDTQPEGAFGDLVRMEKNGFVSEHRAKGVCPGGTVRENDFRRLPLARRWGVGEDGAMDIKSEIARGGFRALLAWVFLGMVTPIGYLAGCASAAPTPRSEDAPTPEQCAGWARKCTDKCEEFSLGRDCVDCCEREKGVCDADGEANFYGCIVQE